MSRIRQLACGHNAPAVREYTDECCWLVRCRCCDHEEQWTQREWSASLVRSRTDLIQIQDEGEILATA
jgi:hypothetical protein